MSLLRCSRNALQLSVGMAARMPGDALEKRAEMKALYGLAALVLAVVLPACSSGHVGETLSAPVTPSTSALVPPVQTTPSPSGQLNRRYVVNRLQRPAATTSGGLRVDDLRVMAEVDPVGRGRSDPADRGPPRLNVRSLSLR
jgi:hypothetical protein